ncbi:hypothetical protein Rsub_01410 [Raphidocelis subcapitata]|uniref:Uncharacterized protein n=1 Tax=Raphidocelis subcapitata TaxID=307507 RepID=A0A2V0NMZ2_9CHLO|nr:hypothetical protein Rsub_01410 [Raphidocelis subcapitata]|eukprot:GBF88911.1 hypothetical protein Rsub_01410 [Raphidocelis subcapitata]
MASAARQGGTPISSKPQQQPAPCEPDALRRSQDQWADGWYGARDGGGAAAARGSTTPPAGHCEDAAAFGGHAEQQLQWCERRAQEQQQQQQQHDAAAKRAPDAAAFAGEAAGGRLSPEGPAAVGWFRKCRGCGAMTARELAALSTQIPFCARCQARTEEMAARQEDGELWASLLYVHNAWSAAGV